MTTLVARDVQLHFQCAGEGESLILVHGLGANLAFWYPFVFSALARKYRVIIYDLRGHGHSSMPASGYTLEQMVADLRALVDHLGVSRPHVIGHSFGARVALAYAIAHPSQVGTLTVADTLLEALQPRMRLRDWPYWGVWKQQLRRQGLIALPKDHEYIDFRLLVRFNQYSGQVVQGEITQRVRRPRIKRRDMGRRGGARWERLMAQTSARRELEVDSITPQDLACIAVPTLLLYGEYSHCLATGRRLRELILHSELYIVPEAGHFHPAVKPRTFVRRLRQFLRAHAGPAASAEGASALRLAGPMDRERQ
jgi:pimeloyl-ACP methyl ester carboxylesterase